MVSPEPESQISVHFVSFLYLQEEFSLLSLTFSAKSSETKLHKETFACMPVWRALIILINLSVQLIDKELSKDQLMIQYQKPY